MISLERIIQISKECYKPIEEVTLNNLVILEEKEHLISPGIQADYYRFLYFLAKEAKFKTVVELGTYRGVSSACIAEGNPYSKVITIDHKDRVIESAKRNNVEYFVQDSLLLPMPPVKIFEAIDLLFIDTLHDGAKCEREYMLYEPYMAKNSLILFDDIYLNCEMKNFWKDFAPDGIKIELPVHSEAGFGMIYSKEDKG